MIKKDNKIRAFFFIFTVFIIINRANVDFKYEPFSNSKIM